jgi:hypothetical protein
MKNILFYFVKNMIRTEFFFSKLNIDVTTLTTISEMTSSIFIFKGGVDPFSPKYRLSSIICDVASFRLFKPVQSEPLHDNNRKFLHIPLANKGIDAINISNIPFSQN